MRKASILLALLLLVAIFTTAQASPARTPSTNPSLTFAGTTANCSVYIRADSLNDSISATIQLWQGSSCVATWYASGVGSLTHSASKAVTSGLQYTLTVDATINGSSIPRVSTTQTCP